MMVGFLNVFAAASIASSAVLGGFTSSRAVLEVIDLLSAHAPINPSHTALLKRRAENLSLQRRISEKCGPQLSRRRAARLSRRAARAGLTLDELHERTSLISRQATDKLDRRWSDRNIRGQAGVPLTVEVDFIDVETCEANLWVDAWHCNSTGYYSGYVSMTGAALSGGGGFGGAGGNNTNGTLLRHLHPLKMHTRSRQHGRSVNAEQCTDRPRIIFERNMAGGLGWPLDYAFDFPGWYSGRSIHFHVKVYENGSVAENGTFIAGRAMHTGQFFFNESIVQEIAQLAPYNTNNVSRLTNDDDQWFAYENAEGYDAVMDVVYAGQDISEGLIGSIIVGLNTSYTSVELSTQWWAGEDSKSASAVTTTDSTLTTTAATVSSTSTDISVGVTAGDKDCDSE
ncbi:Aromatic compound dioxygenase [Rhizoctonia solani]|uniref:Aromatic compound dioxygenase n=1 Tax=Rhizoctonia solani TaxID=456999 RepID=A0A8H7IES6_9AGAM|nr:Aromatic compound dioxygenase [Rhizoctonia solani]